MQRGSLSDIITIMEKGKKDYYVKNSYKMSRHTLLI